MEIIATWIGLGLTAIGMILGGMAYVQQQLKDERNRVDAKFTLVDAEISEERRSTEAKIALLKVETQLEHFREIERLNGALQEEKVDRRREQDRIEETLKGFSDVATAVISMGKSVEHLTEKFTDHQRHTDRALDEVKHTVRSMDEKLQIASAKPARAPRAPRAKK